jgi:hypothetical protein
LVDYQSIARPKRKGAAVGPVRCKRVGSLPFSSPKPNLDMSPALMIPLLTAAGLASFWLFFKSVDFFDKI